MNSALSAILLAVASAPAAADICPAPFTGTGDGTYYTFTGSGACSMPIVDGQTAALNAVQWDGSAHCGECLQIFGPSGSVVVQITDECPECAAGDIDLTESAFAQIADPILGRVPINWHLVDCPVSGPIHFGVDPGGNQYYISLLPHNHRQGVADLSLTIGGGYVTMARQNYDYFVYNSSTPVSAPIDVRITSNAGETLTETLSTLMPGADNTGQSQFAACDRIFASGFNTTP